MGNTTDRAGSDDTATSVPYASTGIAAVTLLSSEQKRRNNPFRVARKDIRVLFKNRHTCNLRTTPDRVLLFCSRSGHPFLRCVCIGVADYNGQLVVFFVGAYERSSFLRAKENRFLQACIETAQVAYPTCETVTFVTDYCSAACDPTTDTVSRSSNVATATLRDGASPRRNSLPTCPRELMIELNYQLRAHTIHMHPKMAELYMNDSGVGKPLVPATDKICAVMEIAYFHSEVRDDLSHELILALAYVQILRIKPELGGLGG